jgi:hypothetical protein
LLQYTLVISSLFGSILPASLVRVFFWASFLSIAHLVCGALTICVKAKVLPLPPHSGKGFCTGLLKRDSWQFVCSHYFVCMLFMKHMVTYCWNLDRVSLPCIRI